MTKPLQRGWAGFDLDGTLAEYAGWKGDDHIGEPVKPMVDLVRRQLALGMEVRVFTARVSSMNPHREAAVKAIGDWTEKHIGRRLPVTAEKDFGMVVLYDDRAVQVTPNKGIIVGAGP